MAEKIKLNLEYIVNSSPRILFPYLEEPNALSQWFADDVNFRESIYDFIWDDESYKAKIVSIKENKLIRYKWLEDEPYYFELEIDQDELTNDVALRITDFAKEEDVENRKMIWNNSIEYLQSVIGG
ncbi:START-like domain-containing protein [Sphingobacterium sp. SRCM116780]|uniref:START-like domain-containing protein n=1 Tax=Sphingobacterium sp. SRCM116780 TaxID=2907623 RepID=UPI001F2E1957|nr:START-like domain-containing protein [Sphingobacterium sp. SRCM116780]UIR55015.1 START-like domain-containing protein [Sphingobacterium sp. SRCM116780]